MRDSQGERCPTAIADQQCQSWRAEYEALKRDKWAGFSGYDGWFARANNAAFGAQAVYLDGRDEEIAELAAQYSELPALCSRLIDLANERGGPDNITVVVLRHHAREE